MTGTEWAIVVCVAVLFCAAVFLALCETAFTRMNRIRAMALEDEGRKGASRLVEMLEKPERTLNTVLFLTLCCHLISASLLGIVFDRVLGGAGIAAGLALEIVFFFVIAEVMPKTYAVQHTDRTALRLSGFLHAITVFPPLRVLSSALIGLANVLLPGRGLREGPFVTEEDLRAMADAAADEESIESEERRLIHSIFEFGDTVVREVMQPRTDMVATEADTPIEDAIEQAIAGGYSRLPVFQESTDNMVGLVYLKDLVRRARDGDGTQGVRTALRVAVFVPEQKRVAELLREMQTQHFHMAIVVDEHGGTAGIVTLEDLLEEIVGEIADEYDVVTPTVERLEGGVLRVPGRVSIDELSELLDLELPATEWDTVAGLVLNLLGHVPVVGEAACLHGWEFRVDRMQGRRVVAVRVHPREGVHRGGGQRRPRRDGGRGARPRGRGRPPLSEPAFRSGFVSLVGRPNVGKSTLVNRIVGGKVSIVSDRPQTTRTTIRGVRTTPTSQLVLLDTPGLHKPRTRLGERTNDQARAALSEVDAVCMVIQADAPIGQGDRFVAAAVHRAGVPAILVVNKLDLVNRAGLAAQLDRAALTLGDFAAYVPVSATTGENVDVLVRELDDRLPEGPQYFPDGVVSDAPETFVAAELVREQLLGMARDELSHSIAVTVEHDEERSRPDLLVLVGDIRVERDSQRGIVIGKGGAVVKEAGTAARRELEALLGVQVHLELRVRVDRDWQRRPAALDRLGF